MPWQPPAPAPCQMAGASASSFPAPGRATFKDGSCRCRTTCGCASMGSTPTTPVPARRTSSCCLTPPHTQTCTCRPPTCWRVGPTAPHTPGSRHPPATCKPSQYPTAPWAAAAPPTVPGGPTRGAAAQPGCPFTPSVYDVYKHCACTSCWAPLPWNSACCLHALIRSTWHRVSPLQVPPALAPAPLWRLPSQQSLAPHPPTIIHHELFRPPAAAGALPSPGFYLHTYSAPAVTSLTPVCTSVGLGCPSCPSDSCAPQQHACKTSAPITCCCRPERCITAAACLLLCLLETPQRTHQRYHPCPAHTGDTPPVCPLRAPFLPGCCSPAAPQSSSSVSSSLML